MRLLKEGKEIPAELEEKLKSKKSPQKAPVTEAQTGSSKKEEGDVRQLTEKVCLSGLGRFSPAIWSKVIFCKWWKVALHVYKML